jgi:hypothetical protein
MYAENREGKTGISSGSALTIRPDGTAEFAPIEAPEEWETGNRYLDMQRMVEGESSCYLPDALQEYSSDFDQNGRCVYLSEYGCICNLAVTMAEWAPNHE